MMGRPDVILVTRYVDPELWSKPWMRITIIRGSEFTMNDVTLSPGHHLLRQLWERYAEVQLMPSVC